MWYIKLLEQHPESFKYRDLKTNDLLFNEEDICNEIGIVIKGQLVISTITYLEKEETINIINENEVFGDLLLFSSNHLYLGNVTATKKSKVALINKNKLLKYLQEDINLLNMFLKSISDKALNIKLQAKLLSHKNIEDRIMYYLNINQKNNIVIIPSVTTLSKILSLPRPSVSRSLSVLESKGFIKRNKNIIYIL